MQLLSIYPPYGVEGHVYNTDANDLINQITGDILYIDPPYNNRQYSSNYHLIETIARYDSPDIKGKTGLRKDNVKSKYCLKNEAFNALENLIKNADFPFIFISYNNEGIISLYDIKEMLSSYGQYQLFQTPYKSFQADKKNKKKYHRK